MKFNYNNIGSMNFYGACPDISARENNEIMKKCTTGNKNEIHKLLEKFGYLSIGTVDIQTLKKFWNPYRYYKSKEWIVIIHSSIEHFFKITYEEEKNGKTI
jgi:hypothetical protein